jgi:alpha-tubulin suppressor-like RCC1 family protein
MLKDYLISINQNSYGTYFEDPQYKLFAWGDNGSGQLGQGNTTSRSSPVQIGSGSTWTQIECGDYNSMVLNYTNGALYSWGNNTYGELGLGDNTARSSPVQISFYNSFFTLVEIFWDMSCGNNHTLMIDTDLGNSGYLYSTGFNGNGELGLGDTSNRNVPNQIGSDNTWIKVSAGSNHSIAKKSDGSIWSWGFNGHGELGHNDTTTRSSPVQIGAGTDWAEISAGCYFTLATKTNGSLWAWGDNADGNLGNGANADIRSPIQIGTLTNWSKVSACIGPQGYAHSLAVKTDGTLWAWGRNDFGQLGDGTTTNKNSPIQIGTGSNWADVAGGHVFSLALKNDGTVWAWGRNESGQFGDGTTVNKSSPVQIGSVNITYRKLAAGWYHSLGLRN